MYQQQLIALKAFYLGRRIVNSIQKTQAIEKINKAIATLSSLNDTKSIKRQLFYMLLLSEVFRNEGESIELRKNALEFSKKFSLDAYEYYMRLVAATTTTQQINDIANFAKISRISNDRVGYDWDVYHEDVYHDDAMSILGLDSKKLSGKNLKFLFNTSMKEIMTSHQLW